jgi:AAT family amino acid transporter
MPAQVFDIISSVSTINFIMVWIIIMWTHLKYRAENKGKLGSFRMPGFPITSWVTIIFYLVILIILALIPATRLPLLISIIFILALSLSYTFLERKN